MSTPAIVIVNGLPGSGKSTVAQGLAALCDRGVWLEGDHIQHAFTVSGCVNPGTEPVAESWRQLDLRWRNLAALTTNFYTEDFAVIVDSLLIPRHAKIFFDLVPQEHCYYVHLAPQRSVGLARDAARGIKKVGDQYDWVEREFAAFSGLGIWIDSTQQSPQETIAESWQGIVSGAAAFDVARIAQER
ncbi:MAG: AAA family ATPase [Propionibacteriaceae bacterium]